MTEISQQELNALIGTAEKLVALLRGLGKKKVKENLPEVEAKLAARVCLGCGIVVPAKGFYMRGLHKPCYGTLTRRIRDGEISEEECISRGLIAIRAKRGVTAAIDLARESNLVSEIGKTVASAYQDSDEKSQKTKAKPKKRG